MVMTTIFLASSFSKDTTYYRGVKEKIYASSVFKRVFHSENKWETIKRIFYAVRTGGLLGIIYNNNSAEGKRIPLEKMVKDILAGRKVMLDCDEMAQLMVKMLRANDIPAWIGYPSPIHAVVVFEIDGEKYWLDPSFGDYHPQKWESSSIFLPGVKEEMKRIDKYYATKGIEVLYSELGKRVLIPKDSIKITSDTTFLLSYALFLKAEELWGVINYARQMKNFGIPLDDVKELREVISEKTYSEEVRQLFIKCLLREKLISEDLARILLKGNPTMAVRSISLALLEE